MEQPQEQILAKQEPLAERLALDLDNLVLPETLAEQNELRGRVAAEIADTITKRGLTLRQKFYLLNNDYKGGVEENYDYRLGTFPRYLLQKYGDDSYGYLLYHSLIGSSLTLPGTPPKNKMDFPGEDSVVGFMEKLRNGEYDDSPEYVSR